MKILCICKGGNVRSVALAQLLKNRGYDALAVGAQDNSQETLKMLEKWADKIVDVRDYLPEDIWRNPRHPDLVKKVYKIYKRLKKEWKSVEKPL